MVVTCPTLHCGIFSSGLVYVLLSVAYFGCHCDCGGTCSWRGGWRREFGVCQGARDTINRWDSTWEAAGGVRRIEMKGGGGSGGDQ